MQIIFFFWCNKKKKKKIKKKKPGFERTHVIGERIQEF